MVFSRLLRANGFVDDLVQFLQHFRYVCRVALLFQFLVNRFDVVVALGDRRTQLGSINSALNRMKTCRAMISNRRLASSEV